MDRAERTAHQLERKVIDVAEAWELRGCIGQTFTALVLDARADRVEAQLVERPVRVTIRLHDTAAPLALGARIGAKLVSVTVSSGTTEFELTPTPA
jgi:hypothetical protein